jgi:TRAP-type transport system periplasmic protein
MTPPALRFGGYQSPQSIHTKAATAFGTTLAEQFGDDVSFELEGNITASGRNAADLLPLVENGDLTFCYFSASYLASRIPEFGLLDLPFMINDRDHAYAVLDGPLGRLLTEKLETHTGFKLLGFWDNGFRHFSNARRPIRTPEDCLGLQIRTLFNDLHRETFSRLGFIPLPLDVKDLVSAVETGRVNAQENPLTNICNFGIFQHHRHITLSGHFFGAAVLLCHRATFVSWSPELRDGVQRAASKATALQRRLAATEDDSVLAKLDPAQNEIVELTEDERAKFIEILSPLIKEQRQVFGNDLIDLVSDRKI